MNLTVNLSEASGEVVAAIVAAMEERGLVVEKEGRCAPFTVVELAEETRLSKAAIYRLVDAGTFKRIAGLGVVLVTVESVRKWQAGKGGAR